MGIIKITFYACWAFCGKIWPLVLHFPIFRAGIGPLQFGVVLVILINYLSCKSFDKNELIIGHFYQKICRINSYLANLFLIIFNHFRYLIFEV